jgi:hypothetical protein
MQSASPRSSEGLRPALRTGRPRAAWSGWSRCLAAVVLGIVLLVFMFLEGTRGPNRFGPDPKGATEGDHRRTFA